MNRRLFALVLPYAACSEYAALSATCALAARFVGTRRRDASRALVRWWRGHRLPPEDDPLWVNTQVTRKTLIRHYMARYPDRHLGAMLDLFPRKLRRPELGRVGRGLSRRRRLRHILLRCATLEIMYVGW